MIPVFFYGHVKNVEKSNNGNMSCLNMRGLHRLNIKKIMSYNP